MSLFENPLPPPPPPFPDRPDLFDEVEWGPLPPDDDLKRAFKVWNLQDSVLEKERQCLRRTNPDLGPEDNSPDTCLARNVYESLLRNTTLPLTKPQQNPDAQYRAVEIYNNYGIREKILQNWSYAEIFSPHDPDAATSTNIQERIEIKGKDINGKWKKVELQNELVHRGLSTKGKVVELKQRLFDDEADRARLRAMNLDMGSLLPRQDLPDWGIHRKDDYMLPITLQAKFTPLEMYTWAIVLSPYNPGYWTSRAYLHYQMGHFDLALGDAYRAQLLCEVLVNPTRRNAQPGLYVRVWDAVERHVLQCKPEGAKMSPEIEMLRGPNGVNCFIPPIRRALHHIVCLSLLALQCWSDYQAMEEDLPTKVVLKDRDKWAIDKRQKVLKDFVRTAIKEKQADKKEFFYESHYGYVRGTPYPFCQQIFRSSLEILERINTDVTGQSQTDSLKPPKIEVRQKLNGGLGVFATEDIPTGEIIYVDEPSIRGHLHPLHVSQKSEVGTTGQITEDRCENCRRVVYGKIWQEPQIKQYAMQNMDKIRANGQACWCSFASEPLAWCLPRPSENDETKEPPAADPEQRTTRSRTQKRTAEPDDEQNSDDGAPQAKKVKTEPPSCLEIASALYHFRACGRDWTWLHDSMRPVLWPKICADESQQTLYCSNEKHGTILSLMLREVFDITLERRETDEQPNLLAYEIDELLPLMGAGRELRDHWFPFSYAANIRVPFDILQYLGVNIFRDLTFDTWVIQVVLRKLLINAIPWDGVRRLKDIVDTFESKEFRHRDLSGRTKSEHYKARPSINDLYIFTGVSLFNHTCYDKNNVTCDWDTVVPNRMILWAASPIKADEELCISYASEKLGEDTAQRLFGQSCECCKFHPIFRNPFPALKYPGNGSSESSIIPDSSEEPGATSFGSNQKHPEQAVGQKPFNKSKENISIFPGDQAPAIEEDQESSTSFAPEQAPTPRPEDEGDYDEADFAKTAVEVREHSGVPMTEYQTRRHAEDLRTKLRAERKHLPRDRLGTKSTTSDKP